jgi:hypothetical protein
MKTTIHIPDSLFKEARRLARREHTTLKALVEQGLRQVLAERRSSHSSFHLRKVTFNGEGLHPQLAATSWQHVRELSYEGRGG